MRSSASNRRWQRQAIDLPLGIAIVNGPFKQMIPGRATEISEGGMALYAGVNLKPGELMEIEFQIPGRRSVTGIVRSRTGYCFGLEFLTPLRG